MVILENKINPEPGEKPGQTLPAVIPLTASPVELGMLQASTPGALVSGAAELAAELARIIDRQHLAVTIQGRQWVRCEGWTTLGVMLGCVAREVSTTEDDGIYIATVELVRMSDGAIISRASAECGSDDEKDKHGKPIWANRPRHARRSMAQSRAVSKACRLAFSWIMVLTGYESKAAAEEMQPERVYNVVNPTIELEPAWEEPRRISAAQHKRLEAQIGDYGLDRERVKAWVLKACSVAHFSDLRQAQFERVQKKLAQLAVETGSMTPQGLLQKAAEKRAAAKSVRDAAQYADGPAYRNEIRQAEQLAEKAKWLERLAAEMEMALKG